MAPEFEKAVFEAQPGTIPPTVRTDFGYHVIRVDAHTVEEFEKVRDKIEREVRKEKLKTILDDILDAAALQYDPAYFAGKQ